MRVKTMKEYEFEDIRLFFTKRQFLAGWDIDAAISPILLETLKRRGKIGADTANWLRAFMEGWLKAKKQWLEWLAR